MLKSAAVAAVQPPADQPLLDPVFVIFKAMDPSGTPAPVTVASSIEFVLGIP